ncbi:hypothetical protein [Streptosporangium canum]|nr:hypothetical protein [Streptosporangium canum]
MGNPRPGSDARRELGRGDRVRLGLALASAVAFVPWAAYWGLLMP